MDSAPLLLGAGLLAGAMNALAGGGSFLALPALVLAGVPSLAANASSTVALFPGGLASAWAYREDLRPVGGVSLWKMWGVSVLGGLLGATLLLLTPQRAFDQVLPWLLLWATLVFAGGRRAGEALRRRVRISPGAVLGLQFLLTIYGGYFVGGVGIMMMAVWSLLSTSGAHNLNPARTVLVAATGASAVLCFIVAGRVAWPQTLLLLSGAVVGGYGGARLARRLAPQVLRGGILVVSTLMTVAFFVRAR
ncbi:sulfite exporter TauE/SafE family protein [Melittangium boletus]|uniref:sulfite exporter TauE/SafE family protein n=1 Tax=Melittangium boletus TaxID=83453 RepID=UPI003DA5FE44